MISCCNVDTPRHRDNIKESVQKCMTYGLKQRYYNSFFNAPQPRRYKDFLLNRYSHIGEFNRSIVLTYLNKM